jgi:hypothetical protein
MEPAGCAGGGFPGCAGGFPGSGAEADQTAGNVLLFYLSQFELINLRQ